MNKQDMAGQSGVTLWSVGIVVEDKMDDGDMIKAFPSEEMPQTLGVLGDVSYDYSVKGTNHQGVSVSSDVKGVSWVAAKWKNFGGDNRITAPNVYENETVMLIKYASDEQVYWFKMGREPAFRRLENVIYAWSNLEVKGEPHDLETSIFIQISTRDQKVHLHIPNNRTEKAGYDVTFDMAAGTFEWIDTEKNRVFIDSVNGDLVVNMNRSIELNAPEIRFNGETYVRTKAPEITETGDQITNDASATGMYKAGSSMTSESGGSSTLKAATPVAVIPGYNVP